MVSLNPTFPRPSFPDCLEAPFPYMQIKSTCARPNIKNPGRRKNCSNACGEDEHCVLKLYDPLKEWAKDPGNSNPSIPWLGVQGGGDLAGMLSKGQLALQALRQTSTTFLWGSQNLLESANLPPLLRPYKGRNSCRGGEEVVNL